MVTLIVGCTLLLFVGVHLVVQGVRVLRKARAAEHATRVLDELHASRKRRRDRGA